LHGKEINEAGFINRNHPIKPIKYKLKKQIP